MKRITILLVVLLVLCSIAFAESETTEAEQGNSTVFTFRNDITWGMTSEEVQIAEGRKADLIDSINEHISTAIYGNVVISQYTGGLVFLFRDNSLFCAYYGIDADDIPSAHRYLISALSSLYGEGVAVEGSQFSSLMKDILGPDNGFGPNLIDSYEWYAMDGTIISQSKFIEGGILVSYIDPNFDASKIDIYNVTGL